MRTFPENPSLTDAEIDRLADFLEGCKSGKAMNIRAAGRVLRGSDRGAENCDAERIQPGGLRG